jgi:hypothetical protein
MLTLVLFCLLLLVSWPLALMALGLYALIWVLFLPFRLLGFALTGVFELLAFLLRVAFWPFTWAFGGRRTATA